MKAKLLFWGGRLRSQNLAQVSPEGHRPDPQDSSEFSAKTLKEKKPCLHERAPSFPLTSVLVQSRVWTEAVRAFVGMPLRPGGGQMCL